MVLLLDAACVVLFFRGAVVHAVNDGLAKVHAVWPRVAKVKVAGKEWFSARRSEAEVKVTCHLEMNQNHFGCDLSLQPYIH